MKFSKVTVYLTVIIAGLIAGTLGPSAINSVLDVDPASETEIQIEGDPVTDDPELDTLRQFDEGFENESDFSSISRKDANGSKIWVGGPYRYVPGEVLEGGEINDSLIVNSGPGGSGNLYQVVTLPENSDLSMYIRGKNAAEIVPTEKCERAKGFLQVFPWEGDIPPENYSRDNLDTDNALTKNVSLTTNESTHRMSIPQSLEGEPVLMAGGVTNENRCDNGDPTNYLKIQELVITDQS